MRRGRPSLGASALIRKGWTNVKDFLAPSLGLRACSFLRGGIDGSIFAPGSIYEEYLRWGYPHWFHFVTGSLELTTAVLLARARTRLWGAALGCTVMLAALATVTLHGEYGHGVPPLIVATLSIVVGWIAWRKRLPRAVGSAPLHRANEFVTVRCKTLDFCTSATAARGPFRVISRPDAVKSRGPLSPESGPFLARL